MRLYTKKIINFPFRSFALALKQPNTHTAMIQGSCVSELHDFSFILKKLSSHCNSLTVISCYVLN